MKYKCVSSAYVSGSELTRKFGSSLLRVKIIAGQEKFLNQMMMMMMMMMTIIKIVISIIIVISICLTSR